MAPLSNAHHIYLLNSRGICPTTTQPIFPGILAEPEIANLSWAIPEKIQTGGLRIYSFETPSGISNFLTLHLEIPDKTKLNPWIFHKIVLDPLDIPKPKTKTPGNSTLFFLGHAWKFHFLFN